MAPTAIKPSARAVAVRRALDPLLQRLAQKPEAAGVCVLGSFALSGIRPAADIFSDFDIALFIDIPIKKELLALDISGFQQAIQPSLPAWLPNFKFVYPEKDIENNTEAPPLQINIHQLVLGYEEQERIIWPADRREAFANTSDIVYDPNGKIAKLISIKSRPPKNEIQERINNNLALIPVTIEHSVEKCALRNNLGDAVLGFGETMAYLLDLIYALNLKDIPHGKWRLKLLDTLEKSPVDCRARAEALLISGLDSSDCMLKKIALLRELYEEVKVIALTTDLTTRDPYRHLVTEVRPGFQLINQSSADKRLIAETEQYDKMRDSNWNRHNFYLQETGETID